MKLINGMDFVDDAIAIGKWEFFDVIQNIAQFDSGKPTSKQIPFGFKDVYFMPNGQGYWIFEGWTKNKLLVCHGGDEPILCLDYTIETFNNEHFMFIDNKEENEQGFIVLKKKNSQKYCIDDIKRKENINLAFVLDKKILGTWKTVGFVSNVEDFDSTQNYQKDLWLVYATFFDDGTVYRKYYDTEWTDKWTSGKLLDQKKSVVSNYFFKTINNVEYMFLEWKMGNYVYGGMPAEYYVFVKQK